MITERVECVDETDEIARDEFRPLVDQLIERVLAIGTGLAPVDWPGLIVNLLPLERHVLAIALHGQLLEIGGEALQILLVGKHCNRLRIKKRVVPEGKQTHYNRQVAVEWRGAEMFVHGVEAG